MGRELSKVMNRELQLQLLSTPVAVTLKDLLRFKMYALESDYRLLKENSIFGTLQLICDDRICSPVHVEIFKDRIDLDVILLIGKLKKVGIICSLDDILSAKVLTDQAIGKTHGVYSVATFMIVAELNMKDRDQ